MEDDWGSEPPSEIQTDWGGEFESNALKGLLQSWNTKFIHGRPYHPQSNGKAERLVQTIKRELKLQIRNGATAWDGKILKEIEDRYNNRIHRTTKFRPIELESEAPLENPPNLPKDLFLPPKQLTLEKGSHKL